MSYNFLNQFRIKLYKLISEIGLVKTHIKKILFSIKQNEIFPVIYIRINRVNDLSKYNYEMFEVDFDILIFLNDTNGELAFSIASEIKSTLKAVDCSFSNYIIAGISCQNLSMEQAKDLVSSKLTLEYKSLITTGGIK